MSSVALSGLDRHIFEETYFYHLHAHLLTCFYEIHLKFLASHIYFHLDDSELTISCNPLIYPKVINGGGAISFVILM